MNLKKNAMCNFCTLQILISRLLTTILWNCYVIRFIRSIKFASSKISCKSKNSVISSIKMKKAVTETASETLYREPKSVD
jgi:hypothetical protein